MRAVPCSRGRSGRAQSGSGSGSSTEATEALDSRAMDVYRGHPTALVSPRDARWSNERTTTGSNVLNYRTGSQDGLGSLPGARSANLPVHTPDCCTVAKLRGACSCASCSFTSPVFQGLYSLNQNLHLPLPETNQLPPALLRSLSFGSATPWHVASLPASCPSRPSLPLPCPIQPCTALRHSCLSMPPPSLQRTARRKPGSATTPGRATALHLGLTSACPSSQIWDDCACTNTVVIGALQGIHCESGHTLCCTVLFLTSRPPHPEGRSRALAWSGPGPGSNCGGAIVLYRKIH